MFGVVPVRVALSHGMVTMGIAPIKVLHYYDDDDDDDYYYYYYYYFNSTVGTKTPAAVSYLYPY